MLHNAERRLGFQLPGAVSEVYQRVANGGFGPGYGLIGLAGGVVDDLGRDVIADYLLRRQPDPDDATWEWPEHLLAVCHWGCGIYSCLDCGTEADPSVVRFDANPVDGDWSKAFFPEDRTFSVWLDAWIRGADLWEDGFRRSPFQQSL